MDFSFIVDLDAFLEDYYLFEDNRIPVQNAKIVLWTILKAIMSWSKNQIVERLL
jgi:hypothetical protein